MVFIKWKIIIFYIILDHFKVVVGSGDSRKTNSIVSTRVENLTQR